MSLLTYQDVHPWARSIKQQTSEPNIPPWFIDKAVGIKKFKNDVSLSDAEISMISKWVDAGAPMGNPSDMPPARTWGEVTFDPDESKPVYSKPVETTTQAVFNAPGSYWVRAVLSDGQAETNHDIMVKVTRSFGN